MFSIPFHVEKSVTINKTSAEVFASVADFSTWPHWSPWLCQEPACPVTITGSAASVGHSQAWDGDIIGSGKMRITAVTQNESIDYELHFLKPWRSVSQTAFRFAPEGSKTKVTWSMRGTVPIFMFFMKNMMSALVGSDFSRGLGMMKEYLETGSVVSKTDIKGVVDREGFYYVGKHRLCSLTDVGPAMEEDLSELGRMLETQKLPKPEHVFSIYHRYDMVNEKCEYTSGFLYRSKPEANEDLASGFLSPHKALRVDHQGPYRHLGNAWSAAMGCSRSKHKTNKSVPMYEVYSNDPHEVAENERGVEIYLPVKG